MKKALILTLLASSILIAEEKAKPEESTTLSSTTHTSPVTAVTPYVARDFSYILGMKGLSDQTMQMHFKLYQGYVNNTNLLLSILAQYSAEGKESTPQYAEIKRRLGWEFDGMRLHEFYFENLGGKESTLAKDSSLYQRIEKDFGSFEKWKQDFMMTGVMRGIGWVILYHDPIANRLLNVWIGDHDKGHLAGAQAILVMDVWEHAYLLDYGLNRMDYIKSFFNNVDWNVVQKRYPSEKKS